MRIRYNGNKKSNGLGILIVGIFMIVMSVKMLSFAGKLKALEERCTEVTTGVVTNVEARRRTSGRKGHRRTYYVYLTEYIYSVDDVDINSSAFFSESERLAIGNEITVHYNPDDPKENYAGESTADSYPKGVLTGMLVLGIIFVLVGFRLTVKRR